MVKVLIADDSDMMRKIAKMSLEREGHHVVEAHNGVSAVEIVAKEMPQAILMDAEMPEMDGWEACKAIKMNPRTAHIPVLMCSGHDLSHQHKLLTEAGANGYITKPYHPAQIARKIHEVLAK